MSYKGYLLKFGDKVFPMNLMIEESYRCIPKQRRIDDDYRDMNNERHLFTSYIPKAIIEVQTKKYITLGEMRCIKKVMQAGMIDEREGRYKIAYWNAEKEDYEETEVHIEDMEFVVLGILNTKPVYDSLNLRIEEV